MKSLWLVLLTAALAWGVWSLLGTNEVPTGDDLPADEAPEQPDGKTPVNPSVDQSRAVLTVTVRTSHGAAPPESTAGYVWGHGERVRKVDEKGQVRFSDAPLGHVTLVAHAPGYEDGSQARYLSAGVPTDIVIVLKHAGDLPPDKSSRRNEAAQPRPDESKTEEERTGADEPEEDDEDQRPVYKRSGGGTVGR